MLALVAPFASFRPLTETQEELFLTTRNITHAGWLIAAPGPPTHTEADK